MLISLVDDTANTLMALPLEPDTIADAVYSMSDTINGKHFAEEFIRRKRLADKGVVEKQPTGPSTDNKKVSGSSGGWSEVAKKGGNKENAPGPSGDSSIPGFKVVPSRKKGKK